MNSEKTIFILMLLSLVGLLMIQHMLIDHNPNSHQHGWSQKKIG